MYDNYSLISKRIHRAAMMKLILALFVSLAIIGLGQSHQFPDFGEGPLHEDFQDFLDLFPAEQVAQVVADYVQNDDEVKHIIDYLANTPLIKNLVIDFEAIDEVRDHIDYLQNHGIFSYDMVNQINRALGIEELVPPTPTPPPRLLLNLQPSLHVHLHRHLNLHLSLQPRTYTEPPTSTPEPTPEPTRTEPPTTSVEPVPISVIQRTGGLSGLFKDVGSLMPYSRYISLYVNKSRNSHAFRDLLHELRHGTLQRIVNKLYKSNSFQIILNGLKNFNVNVKIVEDVLYILFDVTTPRPPKSLREHLIDFLKLIPTEQFTEVLVKYLNEDQQVRDAITFLFTPEFHDLLRSVESLEEHQKLVVYLEKLGLPVIEGIQEMHKALGMEDYVPPKIEDLLKSQIGAQEVGDGMKGLIRDLYNLLPLRKIDALFRKKLHDKVFAHFIESLASPEFVEISKNLVNHETFKQYIAQTNEKGLELLAWAKLSNRMIGLKWERIFVAF
ncbi:LOW QUALITY PROTEIN: uncharacterized protein LOC114941645 [Nylanderia fulva]|uniref:LOW QUALITY PROTEIN: uncharacterized protein LOC114941645 n=1 Tax=Nylanderia fulva TaxID=613905 RepID=UPI0010FB2ADF|nr:LOW QUALITY PROTEIN: uncharacterized protein LOC114941645 [Nylanderia fulva]